MNILKNSKKISYAILSSILFLSVTFFMVSYNNLSRGELRAATWYDSKATSFAGGYGSSASPYQIETPEQLGLMAYNVNNGIGKNSFYVLKNNISLLGKDWVSIGTSNNKFAGQFDGAGHSITEMKGINGLFGYTNSGSIKNLFLSGKIDTEGAADVEIGGLVGYSYSTNIESISTDIRIISDVGSYWVGGVVGYQAYGSLTNVANNGNISYEAKNKNNQNHHIGGVAGVAISTSLENVINYANISAYGSSPGTRVYLIGGIIGWSSNSSVAKAINYGEINSGSLTEAVVGGLIGNPTSDSKQTYANLMNFGKVTGTSSAQFVGGVFGRVERNTSIIQVINRGEVKGKTSVGGVAGYLVGNDNISILYAYNHGAVTGTGDNVGGIVGYLREESDIKLENVSNNSIVTGKNNVGGIIGLADMGVETANNVSPKRGIIRINYAYNSGTIKATNSIAAGIVGRIDGKTYIVNNYKRDGGAKILIEYLFNEGTIYAYDIKTDTKGIGETQSTAAFVGFLSTYTIYVKNSFNVGDVWKMNSSGLQDTATQQAKNQGNILFGINVSNAGGDTWDTFYYPTRVRFENLFGINRGGINFHNNMMESNAYLGFAKNANPSKLFYKGATVANGGLSYTIGTTSTQRTFYINHANYWSNYTTNFDGYYATSLDAYFTSYFGYNNPSLYGGKFYLTAFYW